MVKEKFTHKILVRCTEEQYQSIKKESEEKKVPIAQLVRFVVFGGRFKKIDRVRFQKIAELDSVLSGLSAYHLGLKNIDDEQLHSLQMEVKKAGINVNQIARNLNAGGNFSKKDLEKVEDLNGKIDDVLRCLGCRL
ncbi:MAG: MobC family plasmid mobilization relaxosome protein [Ligilactobacillus salivarius]|nr:MobC family plasmid mobilization relaxosome protein [Ligilactobacillus salivarius]